VPRRLLQAQVSNNYQQNFHAMPFNPFSEESEEQVIVEEEITGDTTIGEHAQLIVYNDEVNTFDWVIKSLMTVLRHTSEQAEQLSLIIHSKGKATVKTAPFNELRPKKDALVERGLSAVIEDA
jgi:ATP-dependent Clp protease adaptor protein ClpS